MPREANSSAEAMAVANDDIMDAVGCLVSLRCLVTKENPGEQIPTRGGEVMCVDLTAVAYDLEADCVGGVGPALCGASASVRASVLSVRSQKRAKLYHRQVASPVWPFRTAVEVKTGRNYDMGVEIVQATMRELRGDISAAEKSAANLAGIYEASVAVLKELVSREACLSGEWLEEAKGAMLGAKRDCEKGGREVERAKERLQIFCETVDGCPKVVREPGSSGFSYISCITMLKRNVRELMEAMERLKGSIKFSQYELHEANKMQLFNQTEIDRQVLIDESRRAQVSLNNRRDKLVFYEAKWKTCKKELDCMRTAGVVRMMV